MYLDPILFDHTIAFQGRTNNWSIDVSRSRQVKIIGVDRRFSQTLKDHLTLLEKGRPFACIENKLEG